MTTTIVWLRNDLRLTDNPALYEACRSGKAVVAVFIWSPNEDWAPGAASRSWLHHSLEEFSKQCKSEGLTFVIRLGEAEKVLKKLIKETKADEVFWNRRYEPAGIKIDDQLQKALSVNIRTFRGNLLFEPEDIVKKYKVFTPFWKQCLKQGGILPPLRKPTFKPFRKQIKSLNVEELGLLPKIHWDKGFYNIWHPGEKAAHKNFLKFLKSGITDYKNLRNFPYIEGTSRMSPHLHFGEISPRWIWKKVHDQFSGHEEGVKTYLSEIGWREFAYHLLVSFPKTPQEPLYEKFKKIQWSQSRKKLEAWQQGQTGYPIVDAGMRQLWQTGWMHNRVRMIVGSFLVKDLLISWRKGEEWFWDTLIDADLANNTLGWQWVGGCGADASPFFRIFNPTTQGEKFDPDGDYIKLWVPELSEVPKKWIHKPWEFPGDLDYPDPLVDHNEARKAALEVYNRIKN